MMFEATLSASSQRRRRQCLVLLFLSYMLQAVSSYSSGAGGCQRNGRGSVSPFGSHGVGEPGRLADFGLKVGIIENNAGQKGFPLTEQGPNTIVAGQEYLVILHRSASAAVDAKFRGFLFRAESPSAGADVSTVLEPVENDGGISQNAGVCGAGPSVVGVTHTFRAVQDPQSTVAVQLYVDENDNIDSLLFDTTAVVYNRQLDGGHVSEFYWTPFVLDVVAATNAPTPGPTAVTATAPSPVQRSTKRPTDRPTSSPSPRPTSNPTAAGSIASSTVEPSPSRTFAPFATPTIEPTPSPTPGPEATPTNPPRLTPAPSQKPSTRDPTNAPTPRPTPSPIVMTPGPTQSPTIGSTPRPTLAPTAAPILSPAPVIPIITVAPTVTSRDIPDPNTTGGNSSADEPATNMPVNVPQDQNTDMPVSAPINTNIESQPLSPVVQTESPTAADDNNDRGIQPSIGTDSNSSLPPPPDGSDTPSDVPSDTPSDIPIGVVMDNEDAVVIDDIDSPISGSGTTDSGSTDASSDGQVHFMMGRASLAGLVMLVAW